MIDERMSAEHQEILDEVGKTNERVEALSDDMEEHVAEAHAALVTQSQVDQLLTKTLNEVRGWMQAQVEERQKLNDQVGELAEVVLGERVVNFDGEVERHGGLKAALSNGNLRFALPWPQLWTLVGTIMMATAVVVAAIITASG